MPESIQRSIVPSAERAGRWFTWVALVLLLAAGAARAQAPESRLALVIGNGAYKQSPLRNAVADARLMDAALREAGFEVLRAENATLREMRRLVRDFGERLQRAGGVGLFYFAGHGVQIDGENYLVSTDSDIRHEDEVPDDSISAQLVLEKMGTARNRMNILILDACRNNPFASRTRSTANGLAAMNAPAGTLVAYATAPGAVAFDGSGTNGLYTRHLAAQIRTPGLRVEEVFKRVRVAVRRDSGDRQTPWENTALEGDFFFRPPSPAAAAPAAAPAPRAPALPDAAAFELAFWESVKDSRQKSEFEEYLRQYPQGRFAGLARGRLAALEAAAAPATPAPPRPADEPVLAAARPAAAPAVPPASAAGGLFALGDRLLFKDSDPVSGVAMREFVRTVTRTGDDLLEFDGGQLRIGPGGRSSVGGNAPAEVVLTGAQQDGRWPAQFVPAARQAEAVPLQLSFDSHETRRIGSREVVLARATVRGFASRRDGIPGAPATYGSVMRGHVLLDPEHALVVEVHITTENPYYGLRRQWIGLEAARR